MNDFNMDVRTSYIKKGHASATSTVAAEMQVKLSLSGDHSRLTDALQAELVTGECTVSCYFLEMRLTIHCQP